MIEAGEVAIVTGAGSGMGQLTAWRLAAAGVRVAAWDVSAEGLARTSRRAPQVHPLIVDVSDTGAVAAAAAAVAADVGPAVRLVNAAAIAPTGQLLSQDPALIRRMMEVNYLGVVNVTSAVAPGMVERGRGEIVQYASLAGWLPSTHFGAYSATKFAVVAYTETLAHEVAGTGVKVVGVCPPIVATPLLDQITSRPPGFDRVPPLDPAVVVDAVERTIARGDLWCFPGTGTRALWRLRRLAPGMLWRRLDALAG